MHDHLTRRRRKEIASLHRKKEREARGELLLEGVRGVESSVVAGAPLVEVIVTPEAREESRVRRLISQVKVPVYEVSSRELDKLSDARTHQGVLAVARMEKLSKEEITELSSMVALDGVQDPGNVGTIMRTAAWFGIEAVVAGSGTAGLFGPKVVRAAAGSLWDVRLGTADHLPSLLDALKERGAACYGADLEGTPCHAWRPGRPSVLVLGSEAHGISPEVAHRLDERVSVPGAPGRRGTESLNVAVASGILLFHYARLG